MMPMGWNDGYTIWEHMIITLYDRGLLTKDLLQALADPFKNRDIDHGGSRDLTAEDGSNADEIVVKIMEPEAFAEISKDKPYIKDWRECIGDEEKMDALGEYHDKIYAVWCRIGTEEWGFR